MAQRKRPTRADVAALAGVSTAIVSTVLSGKQGGTIRPSAETAERVRQAARELDYLPNVAARSLARGRNGLLGVYTFTAVFPAETNDFYQPFLLGIEREAEVQGQDLILFTSSAGGEDGKRRIYRAGGNRLRLADGCILLGQDSDRSEVDRLAEEDFPFVFIGRREVPGRELAYVGVDYRSAVAEIVDRIAGLGHRRLAYLGSGDRFEAVLDRRSGYETGVARNEDRIEAGIDVRTGADGVDAAGFDELLRQGVTAFVSEGDAWRSVVAAAAERGLRIPEDLSLVVLGDPPGDTGPAELSRLVIPRREIGVRAVRLLVAMLGPGDAELDRQILLPAQIVPGQTLGRAPRRRP